MGDSARLAALDEWRIHVDDTLAELKADNKWLLRVALTSLGTALLTLVGTIITLIVADRTGG